jgi:hypothetical protein
MGKICIYYLNGLSIQPEPRIQTQLVEYYVHLLYLMVTEFNETRSTFTSKFGWSGEVEVQFLCQFMHKTR